MDINDSVPEKKKRGRKAKNEILKQDKEIDNNNNNNDIKIPKKRGREAPSPPQAQP